MVNQLLSWQSALDLAWLLFLVMMLWYFWRDRSRLAQTRFWLITKGRITLFEWTREGHRLWPRVQYTYQVFEQTFQGEYLFLDTSHNNPSSQYARKIAYKAAVAYEQDAEIDVFYNPNNPEQAALDVTIPTKLNLIIVFLVILIVLHLGVVAARWLL